MRIRHITGTAALAAGAALLALPAVTLAAAPVSTVVHTPSGQTVASVDFDGGTSFGLTGASFAAGSGVYGFALAVPASISASDGVITFTLPDITLNGVAGWALSDPRISLGNLAFTESGTGSTAARFSGVVNFSGWPSFPITSNMVKTVTSTGAGSQGYFSTVLALPGPFTSLSFTGGQLRLTALPGSGAASIDAQSTDQFRLSFNAVALVPEPGTWAMLLSGLLAIGWAARRRLPAR